jgi:hypothetical protein
VNAPIVSSPDVVGLIRAVMPDTSTQQSFRIARSLSSKPWYCRPGNTSLPSAPVACVMRAFVVHSCWQPAISRRKSSLPDPVASVRDQVISHHPKDGRQQSFCTGCGTAYRWPWWLVPPSTRCHRHAEKTPRSATRRIRT